jgi:hypothetical protein
MYKGTIICCLLAAPLMASATWEMGFEYGLTGEYGGLAGAEVEETEAILSLEWMQRTQWGQFAGTLDAKALDADWSVPGAASPLAGIYEDVETIRTDLMWTWLFDDHWSVSARAAAGSAIVTEGAFTKADFSDAFGFGGTLTVNYRIDLDLMLGFGVMYRGEVAGVEDQLFPFVQVYWKINEAWTLQTRNGVLLDWHILETELDDRLRFLALWRSREWHLGFDNGTELGYEDEGVALGLTYEAVFAPGWAVEPSMTYLLAREATFWENGSKGAEYDLDDTWRFAVTVSHAF